MIGGPTPFFTPSGAQTSFAPWFVRGWAGGRIWYVGSVGGPEGRFGDGSIIDAPLSSVFGSDGALKRLGARVSRGDVIRCLPNHVETIAVADAGQYADSALAGVSIEGMGVGLNRPSFTLTVATASILFDTANMELGNFRLFFAGANAAGSALTVAAPMTMSANGGRLVNNEIYMGFDADQIVGDGLIVTGDDCVVAGNRIFAATAAVPTNTLVTLTGADRFYFGYNWIKGATDATTRGVIDSETTACTELLIEHNYIANFLASSTIGLSLTSGDTGLVRYNQFFVNSGILPITAAETEWVENYVTNGEGEAGALVGTPSA